MCHWREAGGRTRSSEEVAPCVRGGGARPGRLARAAVRAAWGCWLVPIARPCSHVVDVAVARVHLTLEFVHNQFLGRGELCGGHIGHWRGAFLGRVEGCLCKFHTELGFIILLDGGRGRQWRVLLDDVGGVDVEKLVYFCSVVQRDLVTGDDVGDLQQLAEVGFVVVMELPDLAWCSVDHEVVLPDMDELHVLVDEGAAQE